MTCIVSGVCTGIYIRCQLVETLHRWMNGRMDGWSDGRAVSIAMDGRLAVTVVVQQYGTMQGGKSGNTV